MFERLEFEAVALECPGLGVVQLLSFAAMSKHHTQEVLTNKKLCTAISNQAVSVKRTWYYNVSKLYDVMKEFCDDLMLSFISKCIPPAANKTLPEQYNEVKYDHSIYGKSYSKWSNYPTKVTH